MEDYEHDYTRVAEDDPLRCQGRMRNGNQCLIRAVPGGSYCPVHGGTSQLKSQDRQELRNYQLNKYRQRVGELSSSPALKSLNEEIGILRMSLENALNQCNSAAELMVASQSISDMVLKIERLVTSCHKLDKDMCGLIGADDLRKLANDIIEIVGRRVPAEELSEVAVELQIALEKMKLGSDNT